MPKHFVHIRSRLPEALQLQIRQPGHLVLARLACLTRSLATWWGRKHGVTQTFRHRKLFSGAVDPSQVRAIHQDWRSLSDLQRDTLSRLDGRMISDDGQMVGWDCWGLADLLFRSFISPSISPDNTWHSAPLGSQDALYEIFLLDGHLQKAFLFQYLPLFLSNAVNNTDLGLRSGLVFLVELYQTLLNHRCLGPKWSTIFWKECSQTQTRHEKLWNITKHQKHRELVALSNRIHRILDVNKKPWRRGVWAILQVPRSRWTSFQWPQWPRR